MKEKKIRSEETKQKLIDSAIEIIGKKGYSKTTLEDIVRNVGLTRGAFYWYFNDKYDILTEVLKRYQNYYYDIDEFEILESAYDTLHNMIIKNLKVKKEKQNKLAYLFRYQLEAATVANGLIDYQRTQDEKIIQDIVIEIERGIAQKEFNPAVDPQQAAVFMFTSLLGFDNYMMLHQTDDYHDPRTDDINIFTYADYIMGFLK